MNNIIEYYIKDNYGNSHMYPANEQIANYLTLLTGKKTLLPDHIFALRGLGYEIKEVLKPVR